MLLNRMAQQEARHHRESFPGITSRLHFTFEADGTRARLSASVQTQTDESNKDSVSASRQKWVFSKGKRHKFRLEIPLVFGGTVRAHPEVIFHSSNLTRVHGRFLMRRDGTIVPSLGETPEWVQYAFATVSTFCEKIRYYGASQFTNPGACPVSFEIEKEGEERKLYRLTGHARILYHMYSAKREDTKRKYKRFLDIVGPGGLKLIDDLSFKEVETSSVNYTVRVGGKIEKRRRRQLIIVPQFRIGRQKLSPNQLSEGTFKTLALLFYVVTDESSALLIEEPEVCIHHGLLSSVLEIIKNFSRSKQMIISTHSDYVLDHVKPENVFRVSYDAKAGTSVHHIRKTMTAKEFSALRQYLDTEGNLGEYWREGGLEEVE